MKYTNIRIVSLSLTAVLILSGCSGIKTPGVVGTDVIVSSKAPTEISSLEDISITSLSSEDTSAPSYKEVSLEFEPHVFPSILYDVYGDEYRDSFFNLCDALQEGKDTFECASEEAYNWCMEGVTLNQLYPVACLQITKNGGNGSPSYENGTGHIYYTNSADDFLQRQESFIEQIEEIKQNNIKPDYSDFEICLALYDYIASNYTYDHDGTLDRSKDGSCGACLKYKKGVCADFGAWYAYLLMQCGVTAVEVQNFGTGQGLGYHAWTYVELDGKGYHIDATWALKSERTDDFLTLDYFLMTDEDRAKADYPPELTEVPLIIGTYYYAKDCPEHDFTADDPTYRFPDFTNCKRYDTEKNVIVYYNLTVDNEEHEFTYE